MNPTLIVGFSASSVWQLLRLKIKEKSFNVMIYLGYKFALPRVFILTMILSCPVILTCSWKELSKDAHHLRGHHYYFYTNHRPPTFIKPVFILLTDYSAEISNRINCANLNMSLNNSCQKRQLLKEDSKVHTINETTRTWKTEQGSDLSCREANPV